MSRDDEIAVVFCKETQLWWVAHIFAQRTCDVQKKGCSFSWKDAALSYAYSIDNDTEYGVCVYE